MHLGREHTGGKGMAIRAEARRLPRDRGQAPPHVRAGAARRLEAFAQLPVGLSTWISAGNGGRVDQEKCHLPRL